MNSYFTYLNMDGEITVVSEFQMRILFDRRRANSDFQKVLIYWKIMNNAIEIEEKDIIHLP